MPPKSNTDQDKRTGCNPFSLILFPRSNTDNALEPLSLIPYSLGLTLKVNSQHLPLRDYRALDKNTYPHFSHYELYATFKFLHTQSDNQKKLLEEACRLISEGRFEEGFREASLNATEHLPDNVKVEASKINFINRVGPHEYVRKWGELCEEVHGLNQTPTLLAYSSLLGLPVFLRRMVGGDTLLIAIQGQAIEDPHQGSIYGFIITKCSKGFHVQKFYKDSNCTEELEDCDLCLVTHSKNASTKYQEVVTAFERAPGLKPINTQLFLDYVGDAARDLPSVKVMSKMQEPPTITEKLRSVLWRLAPKRSSLTPDTLAIIPYGVRLDLQTLRGKVRKETLVNAGFVHFGDLAIYLGAKLLDGNPERQADFLQNVGTSILKARQEGAQSGDDLKWVHSLLRDALQDIPGYTEVSALKIATIYRVGPSYFRDCFNSLAQGVLASGSIPCLIGYAGLSGFGSFVRTMPPNRPWLVFVPESSTEKPFFILCNQSQNGFSSQVIPADANLKEILGEDSKIALIDDVMNTGDTFRETCKFFKQRKDWPPIESFLCVDKA